MRITVELSLYPLQDNPIPHIQAFIQDLKRDPDLEVMTNQMSTQIRGELGTVMASVEAALTRCFETPDSRVLVAKFLNADLPIADRPRL